MILYVSNSSIYICWSCLPVRRTVGAAAESGEAETSSIPSDVILATFGIADACKSKYNAKNIIHTSYLQWLILNIVYIVARTIDSNSGGALFATLVAWSLRI